MRKFLVYFEQVNKTRWEVEAHSVDEAIKKAEKMWREQYGRPGGSYVEEAQQGSTP